jgi:hypothetical protein
MSDSQASARKKENFVNLFTAATLGMMIVIGARQPWFSGISRFTKQRIL